MSSILFGATQMGALRRLLAAMLLCMAVSGGLGTALGAEESVGCIGSLSPPDRSHGYIGGVGYSISASVQCDWTIINTNSWITIASPTNGPAGGPGTVTYNVALNVGPEPRSGVILVGGRPFSVRQAAGHAVILTQPIDQSVLGGGTATFSVTVTGTPPVFYQWQFNQAPLVDGNGVSGADTPTLVLSNVQLSQAGYYRLVITNQGSRVFSRSASLTLNCNFSLASSNAGFSSLGATGSVALSTTTPDCLWSVMNTNPWVKVQSSIINSGNSTVVYILTPNTTGLLRRGTLLIADKPFTITQSGDAFTEVDLPLAEALDTEGSLYWGTIGTPAWFGQTTFSHDGTDAGQSGPIGHGAAVTAENQITGPGTLSFWWKVSSETNKDFLKFFVDGVQQTRISGEVDWQELSYTFPAGIFSCKWTYSKNGEGTAGNDRGWLDQVRFVGGAGCEMTLSSTNATHAFGSATGQVSVAAAAGCSWSAFGLNPWISATLEATGSVGVVRYTVAANNSPASRIGGISIGGRLFTVWQAGNPLACTYAVSPASQMHGSASETGVVSVVTQVPCTWSVFNTNAWVTILSSVNNSGSGLVRYVVADNSAASASRGGMVFIAGQPFAISQAPGACAYAISPTNRVHGYGSVTGVISVTTEPGCAWNISNSNAWVTIVSGGSNSGSGQVTYSITANTLPFTRTGNILIAGRLFSIAQQPGIVSCTYSLVPTNRVHASGAATGSVLVATQAGCAWNVINTNSWIRIVSGTNGIGNGTITYVVTVNPTASIRSGNIQIGSQTFRVTQAGVAGACAERWESRATGPERRTGNTAVWTGNEMIIWGGGRQSQWLGDGARYNLDSDIWTTLPSANAPSGRWFHVAVWTGKEMLVWGGRASFSPINNFNTGARYNPVTDTWTPMSTFRAPSPRSQLMAVWTGKEMIVWGGTGDGWNELNDGGRYNPETDTWTPISTVSAPSGRLEHTAVWTGTEMIVFGGLTIGRDWIGEEWVSQNTGGRYNPVTDTWTPLPTAGAPNTAEHVAVWSGTEMIVWGGRVLPEYVHLNTGARYNPVSNTWTPLSTSGAPSGRTEPAAVWTGTEMIVWAGANFEGSKNDGARYNPSTDSWTAMTQENAGHKRWMWRPDLGLWTGQGMLVYGGSDYPYEIDNTDYYVPSACPLPPSAPKITGQPSHRTVLQGDSVSIPVGVSGTKPLYYQWFFNGLPVDGATNNPLTLHNVQPSQAGNYFVSVTNSAGAATSSVAALTVQKARLLRVLGVAAQQEGTTITLPIQLISDGDVGGMTFQLHYDWEYLKNPQLSWDASIGPVFTENNTAEPGVVTATLALPGTALPAGTQQVGQITFFIQSVPASLRAYFEVEILDMSEADGTPLVGNFGQAFEQPILGRKMTGDNNANDRLDIGDATVVLRYLANLDPIRSWDVPLNDLNQNSGLDSGDVIRILRASSGIEPQPTIPAALAAKALATSVTGSLVIEPSVVKSAPGQTMTMQVKLKGKAPISGAAFQLHYDTNALRLVGTTGHRAGSIIPGNALPMWNVAPGQNNFAIQNGNLSLAVSSALPWSTNEGVLAEITFQVQPGAASQYLWPITLSQAEVTEDGYKNYLLASSGAAMSVRPPNAARISAGKLRNDGTFAFTVTGEPGASYVVETSVDLKQWTPLRTLLATDIPSIITDSPSEPAKFFRVRAEP
jgi:hypothetical protein